MSGETYQAFLTQLAHASGMATPTRADLARLDRSRPQKGRNTDWQHPHDPDARITKMTDGRTHLAHKAEHAVDLETGAIVEVTVHGADQGDTTTIADTVTAAAEDLEAVATARDAVYANRRRIRRARGTPTYASWLNLVERWFAALETKQLRRGVHDSVRSLESAIREFIDASNTVGQPYVWTKTADDILASIARFVLRTVTVHDRQQVMSRTTGTGH